MVLASWSTIFRPSKGLVSDALAFTLLKVSILMSQLVRLVNVMVGYVKMCFLLYRDHTKILDVIKTLVSDVVNSGLKYLSEIMISSPFFEHRTFLYPNTTSFIHKCYRR